MDRISAFTDLCTAQGLFRYGTSAGGVPPTPVKAEYLNLMQEELCNLVLAYLPALDPEDNTQLLQAVRKLVLNYYTKSETDNLLTALKQLIQGLLDLKAPLASPVLTGQPKAPTPAAGDKSKLIATTEFVQGALIGAYPVGSIYLNASSSTNPATLLGFGVWQALGAGRMLIGVGSATDTRGESKTFAAGAIGGEYNHVLTVAEMPSHSHTTPQGSVAPPAPGNYASGDDTSSTAFANPPSGSAGGDQPHNNLPPYLAVYMWVRTS